MGWTPEKLRRVYDRTSGKCHLCHKKVAFKNYGQHGSRGAWEVDHSRARANGGSDHGNNLYAACTSCNRSKQAGSTKTARARNGKTRAPLSVEQRKAARHWNTVGGAVLGLAAGALFGPLPALIGAVGGAHLGSKANPDKAS